MIWSAVKGKKTMIKEQYNPNLKGKQTSTEIYFPKYQVFSVRESPDYKGELRPKKLYSVYDS